MSATDMDEGLKVAEDVADLLSLAQNRQDDQMVLGTVDRILHRHGPGSRSAVRVALAAKALQVSATTVRAWIERGILERADTGSVSMVTSVSLGRVLALLRQAGRGTPGHERLVRALERLRDRDLLVRAHIAADQTNQLDLLTYDETDLAELRS